jgi:hypothetical protein
MEQERGAFKGNRATRAGEVKKRGILSGFRALSGQNRNQQAMPQF